MYKKIIRINPSSKIFGGEVVAPPSKSFAHRLLIASAFSGQKIILKNMAQSDDINATISVLKEMGASICWRGIDALDINNSSYDICKDKNLGLNNMPFIDEGTTFFCGESGTTLRFLIPLGLLSGKSISFDGKGRLKKRPLHPYFPIFDEMSVAWKYNNELPLKLSGRLKSGNYKISGDISSQFISGLLMALVLCDGDSNLELTSELQSSGYVDMTIDTLNKFGIKIENNQNGKYIIYGNQKYQHKNVSGDTIVISNEGDYSQMAFWAVAGAIGFNPIYIKNVYKETLQGDFVIYEILKKMGVKIKWKKEGVIIFPSHIKNIDVSAKNCPDLVPILAVLGTAGEGIMKIKDAKRLRIKESDRLNAIASELNSIGADIIETEDGIIVNGILQNGQNKLNGGKVYAHSDHRIAMSLSIAANLCERNIILYGAESVNKSYPDFFVKYQSLGGLVEVL